jgi:succinate dehydrogenase hydrophobic membrane anchor protein
MSFFKNKLGILLALLYLIVSIVVSVGDIEGSWGGFLLFASAFPFSILSLSVSKFLNNPLAHFVFIFLNAIWWFLLGWLITKIFRKKIQTE